MTWQEILFAVSADNPFIRTIPLIWLLAAAILESVLSLKDRSFFCRTLKKLSDEVDEIRSNCEVKKKAETSKDLDTCPIYKVMNNNKDSKKWLADIETKEDCFWIKIKNMCINYQQAQFFEILFLQFVIAYVATTLDGIHNLAQIFLFIGLLFLIIPTIVYVYGEDPMKIYIEKKWRLSLIFFSWIMVMGLMIYPRLL
jgi:hypothetical protein